MVLKILMSSWNGIQEKQMKLILIKLGRRHRHINIYALQDNTLKRVVVVVECELLEGKEVTKVHESMFFTWATYTYWMEPF